RPDAPGVRGYEVFDGCFWEGAMVRCSGDIIAMSPPLTVEKAELDRLVDTLATVTRRTA
ncbi:MAG TPA: aspartate aminotransferase family protein, partial [Pseudomonas sp.]|nr:aspartate aminotransferase family protein [Pseudomonas sp.]